MKKWELIVKNFGKTLVENSPTILTTVAGVGVVATTFSGIVATPKALYLYEDLKSENPDATKIEIIKVVGPVYIPTLVLMGVTIYCLVEANKINLERNAALLTLLTVSETQFKDYRQKVAEMFGDRKEEKVRDSVAQDRVNSNPPPSTIVVMGADDVIFLDGYSDRYFKSSMEKVNRAVNEFNKELLTDGWLSLNYFYDLIGLPPTSDGAKSGFDGTEHLLELKISTTTTPDSKPCFVLNYRFGPRYFVKA